MRRFALFAFAVLAVGLMAAPGALASTGVKHLAPLGTKPAAMTQPLAVPLAAGSYSITGHVLDYSGNLVAGAGVEWGWWDGTAFNTGGLNSQSGTAADGKFNFSGVQSQPGNNDYLHIYYPYAPTASLEEMYSWGLDFATRNDNTLSPNTYEMQPAQVNVTIANAPATPVEIKVGQDDTGYAQSTVHLTSGAGVAGVLPSSFDDVLAYQPNSIGAVTAQAEWLGAPVSVDAGKTATDTVALDWSKALRAALTGSTCQHSGKPGTTVKMALSNWPASYQPVFVGYDEELSIASVKGPVSTGAAFTVPLKISARAPVDVYEIDTFRNDSTESLVDLSDFYQVCTFKSTPSIIRHGKAVRLSGVVPGTGKVTVYSTTHKVTAQPKTLTAKGWTRMKTTFKVSAKGKFATGLLHPKRTTWYVVKYNGLAFPAFTSVIKVTVH
jgi:hypothetical protein